LHIREQPTPNCFVVIETLVVDYIGRLPVVITLLLPTDEPIVFPNVSFSNYESYPDSVWAFEHDFVGTVIPPALAFDQLLDGSPLLINLSLVLEKVMPACIKMFLASVKQPIQAFDETDHFDDFFDARLFLVSRFCIHSLVNLYFDLVADGRIINPSQTISHGDFSPNFTL
jgi:hypothetical protein